VLGRTTIGHDDAFSVRATDINDAKNVAETIFNNLENTPVSKMTKLINESSVAESLRSDFNTILSMLTRILQQQQEMYKEYLELKKKQVELLERVSQQPQQQPQRRSTTYD
jgi:DNA-binding ferritin-like protein